MASTSNLADVVRHYQHSIEVNGQDQKRLLYCITKLFNLPIKFEHLQETGIGKTVNALRKNHGEVGVAARTLVDKWKVMVYEEEEAKKGESKNDSEDDINRSNDRRSSGDDQEKNGNNSSSDDETQSKVKTKEEKRESKSSSGNKRRSESKSHSKSKSENREKKHKHSKHKHHHHSKESASGSSKSSSSQNHKERSSKQEKTKEKVKEKVHVKQKPEAEKSVKHKSSASTSKSASTSSSSSSSKRARPDKDDAEELTKSKVPKKTNSDVYSNEDSNDGFDSTMGANFGDVLGMLNMPKSSKKAISSSKLKSISKPAAAAGASSSSSANARSDSSPAEESDSRRKSTLAQKPELLVSSAKLEPLDPTIVLDLPTISNNYKPMPLNQTVMDVVFNQTPNATVPQKPAPRNFNESEALAQGISSKTMRTKIYSGVKTGQILQVPSLFSLCIRVLQKNIDALEYTGGVPFELLRPALERATPMQLSLFEEFNPYLLDESDVLWQQHVQHHFRTETRQSMETWREMFMRCQEEKERKLSVLAKSIKASQKISEAPVRKTQLAFVDSLVKPPRNIQRKQEQYGTKSKLTATPAARVATLSNVTPNAAKIGDTRLRVAAGMRDTAQVSAAPLRSKKAPLMAKTLQFIRGRHKR